MDCDEKRLTAMMYSYEPLIRKLSREYYSSSASPSLDIDDFLQEGRIGFINAVRAYDEQKGCAFSSYVENGIRISLRKLLSEKSRLIRFPKYRIEQMSLLDKAEKEGELDDQMLSEKTGLNRATITKLRGLRNVSCTCSLDEQIDDSSYIEFVKCDDFSPVYERDEMLHLLSEKIRGLDGKDGYILKSISGTFGCEKKSRRALSKELSLSYSAITSSYNNSITTLRKAL